MKLRISKICNSSFILLNSSYFISPSIVQILQTNMEFTNEFTKWTLIVRVKSVLSFFKGHVKTVKEGTTNTWHDPSWLLTCWLIIACIYVCSIFSCPGLSTFSCFLLLVWLLLNFLVHLSRKRIDNLSTVLRYVISREKPCLLILFFYAEINGKTKNKNNK